MLIQRSKPLDIAHLEQTARTFHSIGAANYAGWGKLNAGTRWLNRFGRMESWAQNKLQALGKLAAGCGLATAEDVRHHRALRPAWAPIIVRGWVVALALASLGSSAWAGAPAVTIDVGQVVECHEVPTPQGAKAGPNEKTVEAVFHVSVLLESGNETDLEQLRLAIVSPDHRLRVVDFHPRTELASELSGDVEVNSTNDVNASLNVSPSALIAGQYGPVHVQAAPSAGVGISQNRGSKETYHRLSPKLLVLASGTTDAEHGVFFKWRRSSQVALEGSRDATCQFAVPRDWRADWVQIHCEVIGHHRSYFSDKLAPCGQTQVFAGLYLAGDELAQQAARELSEVQLRHTLPIAEQHQGPRGGGYVVYKVPVAEHRCDWFGLASAFGGSNDNPGQPVGADVVATSLQANSPVGLSGRLDALRHLSGR